MLHINGSIQVVPASIGTESGTLRVDETTEQPAVIQNLQTLSGVVQVIIPATAVDSIVEGLKTAKEEAEKKKPPTDLYIPPNMESAEKIAKAHESIINEGKIE